MTFVRMGQESEDMTMVLVKKRDNAGRFDLYNDINDCEMQEEENSHHLRGNCENIDFLLFLIPACVTSLCPQEQP